MTVVNTSAEAIGNFSPTSELNAGASNKHLSGAQTLPAPHPLAENKADNTALSNSEDRRGSKALETFAKVIFFPVDLIQKVDAHFEKRKQERDNSGGGVGANSSEVTSAKERLKLQNMKAQKARGEPETGILEKKPSSYKW
jgi:hypothetical protein